MALSFLALPSAAHAAAPQVKATWVTNVTASSARLRAELVTGAGSTHYRFEYLAEPAYRANLAAARDPFFGATRTPNPDGLAGAAGAVSVVQEVRNLNPEASYRYRVVATNADGASMGPERVLATQGFGGGPFLLDDRGWELVSPVDKNGGEILGLGPSNRAGPLRAATGGRAMAFSSASSFGAGASGAPSPSQYLSHRDTDGWSVDNISPPLVSDSSPSVQSEPEYRLFSSDLARGLLGAPGYPPLEGAPAGYRNFYLRDDLGYSPLLERADIAALGVPAERFAVSLEGASDDLHHVVLSTCAALRQDATEVPDGGGGCDSARQNLYEWSSDGLRLLNIPPQGGPSLTPSSLAASAGGMSTDGSRIYWTSGNDLYVRDGSRTVLVDAEGATFQTASLNGSVALYLKSGHLFRFDLDTETATDLTPAGGVEGVLAASASGGRVYYLTADGVFLDREGSAVRVAEEADTANTPPSTGVARATADGRRLVFASSAELTGYDNTDAGTGDHDSQIYLYDDADGSLTCLSCNPTGERPDGPSSIPGAVAAGGGSGAARI